nr:hypothetical protein [Escherichia coli]
MSVQKEKNVAESVVSEAHAGDSVYASLFEKINLNPVPVLFVMHRDSGAGIRVLFPLC